MATITLEISEQQLAKWTSGAVCHPAKPDVPAFVSFAVSFYLSRLEARVSLARRMEREGRL